MKIYQSLLLLVTILLPTFSYSFTNKNYEYSHSINVSIAPYKYFVEKIAGDTVSVNLMVPSGSDSHSYEPSSRSILKASKADAWFRIGESFEQRAKQAMLSHHPKMEIIDLREGVSAIHAHGGHGHACSHEDCRDPHIWLSVREGKKQARIIADTLVKLYPEHKDRYHNALRQFERELDVLDLELEAILLPLKSRTILVSHPAYAYLCRDYNLQQISIEFEGREPSPQQLTRLLKKARELQVKRVFVQTQHLSKGAKLVANELGAVTIELDPLAEDYMENLRHIAKQIAGQSQDDKVHSKSGVQLNKFWRPKNNEMQDQLG
jgi:zinc transport system substrate-binding protein